MGFFPHYRTGLHPLVTSFSALKQGLIVVLILNLVDVRNIEQWYVTCHSSFIHPHRYIVITVLSLLRIPSTLRKSSSPIHHSTIHPYCHLPRTSSFSIQFCHPMTISIDSAIPLLAPNL